MLHRFEGDAGKRLRVESLLGQKLVAGNRQLAEQMEERIQLRQLKPGELLIEQNASDNDVHLILAGSVDIIANGRRMRSRGPNEHVGEMAAIEPIQRRAASAVAVEETVVATLTEADFSELASRHPEMYRCIARELARRLLQRNAQVTAARDQVRVFIISSVESLGVARVVQNAFAHDKFLTTLWTDGVFKVANYTLQSLEDQIDNSDFAIAIAHADDVTECRARIGRRRVTTWFSNWAFSWGVWARTGRS